ncbi:MAG: transcriptional regulator with XRE-family HTH domain [Candidatus Marinamargulisbacteria bacterium]|jgi:transcriptional regulator with XRE-family HTH domain
MLAGIMSEQIDPNLEKVIDRIAALQAEAKMTNYQLAISSGVTRNVIGRILRKTRSLKVETLMKLIDGLGVSPKDFFKTF